MIEAEIAERELKLMTLRAQLDALRGLTGARAKASPEIDWAKVLAKLPPEFGSADLAKRTPAPASNPQARRIALARWVRSKLIDKLGAGLYRKRPG